MESYETAKLVITTFEEDVIAASKVRCESYGDDEGQIFGWYIYYPEGTETYPNPDKPSVCE